MERHKSISDIFYRVVLTKFLSSPPTNRDNKKIKFPLYPLTKFFQNDENLTKIFQLLTAVLIFFNQFYFKYLCVLFCCH